MIERSNVFRMGFDKTHERRIFRIGCSHCSRQYEYYLKPGYPPEPALRCARAKGWEVESRGRWAHCPNCLKVKRLDVTPAAMRQQVEMVRLLDTHFHVETGSYADPWSDAAIAKAAKLSADAVAKFREAAYGPLRSPELEAASKAIADLRKKLDADIKAACDLIETSKREALAAITELEGKVAKALARRAA